MKNKVNHNKIYLFSLKDILTNNLVSPKILKIKKKKNKEFGV